MSAQVQQGNPRPFLLALLMIFSSLSPLLINYDWSTELDEDKPSFTSTGSDWVVETIDSTGAVGNYSSLALDSNQYPHIAYHDDTNDNLKYAHFNGTAWENQVIEGAINRFHHLSTPVPFFTMDR